MRGSLALLLGVSGFLLGGVVPAAADPVTYLFTGTLTEVDQGETRKDPDMAPLEVGDSFFGSVTFNSSLVSNTGTYDCPVPPPVGVTPCGLEVTIEGTQFGTDGDQVFRFTPGTSTILGPELFFFQGPLEGSPLRDVAGLPAVLALLLIDENNTIPLSEIPTDFDIGDFNTAELRFVYRTGPGGGPIGNEPFITGTLESLVMSIPEPGTAGLVALGLLGLAVSRPRR